MKRQQKHHYAWAPYAGHHCRIGYGTKEGHPESSEICMYFKTEEAALTHVEEANAALSTFPHSKPRARSVRPCTGSL